jgi:DNA-binding MarR family transcriptional regulator
MLTFPSRRPGAPLTSVAEHLGVSRSTASALVDRLVRRQLVSRTEDPQKRRCVMLTLTYISQASGRVWLIRYRSRR